MAGQVAFEVVPKAELPARNFGRAPFSPLTLALARGDLVFIAGRHTRSTSRTLAAQGLKIRNRRGERGGVQGTYVWTEKNGTV